MNSNKIDQKIQSFLKDNPLVKGKSNEEILSIMVDFGVISPADTKEISAFSKAVSSSDKGLVLEKVSVTEHSAPKVEITREEAQDSALDNISNAAMSAQSLFEDQKNTQGDISRVYDFYKELTKDDLSQGKLKQAITLEKLGYAYLNQAKSNTLTKKEYYEHVKEDLLLMTPGIHSMSDESKNIIKQRIDSLTIEEVKLMQKNLQNLPEEGSPEYEAQAKKYLKNFKSLTEDAPQLKRVGDAEVQGLQFESEAKIKPPVNYSDGDELIKFEEVYQYERGTTFSNEKIAAFETAKTSLQMAQNTTAKMDKIHSYLDKALINPRGDWQAADYAKVEMGLKMSLRELFGEDEAVQQDGLKKLLGGEIPNNDVEVSKLLLARLDENHQKIMNGKSLSDFEQEYADLYVKAFGKKNSEQLAKSYVEDNESITARVTSGIQMGGMGLMIVGGAVCLIPGAQPVGAAMLSGGGKLAMTGMVAQTALEAVNESSKTGGMSDEAQDRIIKEGLINLASFAVGAGAGIKGAQVGANLIAKGSNRFVALMAERGTDVAISMAGDMILLGDLNVEGNMIGQITATLTGLKTGKTIAKKQMGKKLSADIPQSELGVKPHIIKDAGIFSKPEDIKPNCSMFAEISAKHNTPEMKTVLSDIETGIGTVKDKKLYNHIMSQLQNIKDGAVPEAKVNETLVFAREAIDVYNTVNGNYTNIGPHAEHQEFIKFMKEFDSRTAEGIIKDASEGGKIKKNTVDAYWKDDFRNHMKYSKLIDFMKYSKDPELSDYFYKNYYLKNVDLPNSIKKQYLEINEKYGVKVISSPISSLDIKQAADKVQQELEEWHSASGGKAKLPPVIDFLGTKKIYYNVGAGGYALQGVHSLGINGLNAVVPVDNFLRHEITHINDKKITGDRNTDYTLPSDIAPRRAVTNPETGKSEIKLDFANCKYRDEFLKAGISYDHVQYAYTNSKEFIAVASEGDMSKYSPEFREVLVKMGMPDFMFKMKTFDTYVARNVKNIEEQIAANPGKKLDEIFYNDRVSDAVIKEDIRPENENINARGVDESNNFTEAGADDIGAFKADKGNTSSKSTPDVIIEAAKVDGVVSKELLDFGKILKDKKIANEYIAEIINKYKKPDGTINPEIIKAFDDLCSSIKTPSLDALKLCINKDGSINQKNLEGAKFLHNEKTAFYAVGSWLKVAQDAYGNFSKEIFADMRKLLEKNGSKGKITVTDVGVILEKCMKDGVIDADNLSIIKRFSDADIPGSNITQLLNYIKTEDGTFDKSKAEKILEIKSMGVPDYSLDTHFKSLLTPDGKFDELMYSKYKELHENPKFTFEKFGIINLSKDKNGGFQENNYKFITNLYNQVTDKKDMPRVITALISAKNRDGVITPGYYQVAVDMLRRKFDKDTITFIMNQCKDISVQDKSAANDGRTFNLALYKKMVTAVEKNQNKNQSGAVITNISLYKGKLKINTLFKDGTNKVDGLSLNLENEIFEADIVTRTDKKGDKRLVLKNYDNKTGIASKSVREGNGTKSVIEETNIIKDKNGKVIRYEYLSPSDVPGIYDVRVRDALTGETKVISSAKVDPETGFTLVEKDLASLDGTRTEYRYEDDPLGNRIIDYKITDKDGNVLMNDSQTFEILSDNKFVSSYNENVYDITFDADNLTVQSKTTGESAEFKFDEFINPKSDRTMLLNLLKQMPGHELIKMRENVNTLTGLQDKMRSSYSDGNMELKTGDDLSVALHEAGHSKHRYGTGAARVQVNEEIVKNYNEEAIAFKKNFPDLHQEYIAYFIDPKQHEKKPWKALGMVMETIAESNSLLNTYYHSPELQVRAHYLQQYFPKTIAAISKAMKDPSDFLMKAVDVQKPAVTAEAAIHGITGETIEASLKTTELRQRGFTDNRIKDMADFVKDDPNKIAVLEKLIPLEHQQFGAAAMKEFIQRHSDVPSEILDKFLTLDDAARASRGGDLSVYEIESILRSLKNPDGTMIDNYKETADFAYKLLGKKSEEGAMSASAIAEVIQKYGIDEKAASGVFELMNVENMGRQQISSKDAVELYEFAQKTDTDIQKIKDVLKLTPEQLKNRGGNALSAKDVQSILMYAPDKADIVKDLASLPTRNRLGQENISTLAAVVQQCGDDTKRLSDIKRLLMLERPLGQFSSETRHLDVVFANMISRDAFDGKVDTIEKLFTLKPKTGEKWLAIDYFTDGGSEQFIKNSKTIFDIMGDNYKQLSPEDIKTFVRPENFGDVVKIIEGNSNLLPEEIKTSLKDINVKKLTPLVKDERLMNAASYIFNKFNNRQNHPDWKRIEDLQFKLENVNDKHVQEYLKNTFDEIDDIRSMPVTPELRVNVNAKLDEMNKVLDVYHTLAGHYTYAGIKGKFTQDIPQTREFINFVKNENPDAANEFSKYATQQYGRPEKLTFDSISEEMGKDFMRDLRVERLKEFAKENPNNPLANHFYDQYLLSFESETSKRCADINKKYNTKIILSELHEDYKAELDFVETELKRWHDASEGKAIMPPVLDFSKCKKKWFDEVHGGTPIGYSEMYSNRAISVSGMSVDRIEDVLRHEMTHSNTNLQTILDTSKYDLNSIMPDKQVEINGKTTTEPDFENCKYREEFLKAGVSPYHIPYGYNDIYEFMAVASEGDMSKYSPEFKQMLVDFGMPEWELKMECVQKDNAQRAKTMAEISQKHPELKTYDELRTMQAVYEMNDMLPADKKWNNDDIQKAHQKFLDAISNGSNREEILNGSMEYIAKHKRPLLSHSGDTKILPFENAEFLMEKCQKLHAKGLDARDNLVKSLFDAGLGDEKSMSYRVKGEQSLFDKIKNYLFDNIDKEKCYFDAEREIRDLFAARTTVKSGDFAKHPDVVKLLQAGDKKGARMRAAELQSQPMADKLKALIDKQSRGESDIEISRISNYKGADGIPYLSEAQLADIKQFALDRGIQLDFVTRIEPDDPMFSQIDAKAHNKKAATKVRDSGYTALQLNFKNKADGQLFEWQFRGDKVTVFAEAEHVPYDLRTGKDIISAHPELEPLYSPIQELLSKDVMTEDQFNKYNEYLTAHYEHLRKLELGFESSEPRLQDYGNFDKRLHARSLEYLHDAAEKIKEKTDIPDAEIIKIIKEYIRLVNS